MTTWEGSVRPKCRSATLPLQEPTTNSATIAAAWIAGDAGSTAQNASPTSDPNVPGAIGT